MGKKKIEECPERGPDGQFCYDEKGHEGDCRDFWGNSFKPRRQPRKQEGKP